MGRTSLRTRQQRSNAVAAATERSEAIGQMNAALKRKFETIEKRGGDAREENLRYYYQLGKDINDIRSDPEKYGRNAMRLLESALSTQRRTLRKAAAFATTYSESEFEGLLARKNDETGFALHWGHVSYLLGLNTKGARSEFAAEAVEKMWDPPAMHKAIKRRLRQGGSGHGRKHTMPKTVAAQIRQMQEVTRVWVAKNTEVWNGENDNVIANIMGEAPDKFTQEMLDDLLETQKQMKQMVRGAKKNVKTLSSVISHVRRAMASHARAASHEATETNGRAHRSIDLSTPATGARRRGGATAGAN